MSATSMNFFPLLQKKITFDLENSYIIVIALRSSRESYFSHRYATNRALCYFCETDCSVFFKIESICESSAIAEKTFVFSLVCNKRAGGYCQCRNN